MSKQKQTSQSEMTKKAIVAAAENLFAKHGYANVTMRQIAKQAGCSHTTIYIYFKDKEALLHELSIPLIQQLQDQFTQLLQRNDLHPKQTLKQISDYFIKFCLNHRNLFTILFLVEATRIDEQNPATDLNRRRIELFAQLKQSLQRCFPIKDEHTLLEYARIYFFMLHGIIGTYVQSNEPVHSIINRLQPTFDEAIDCLIIGLEHKLNTGKRS